MEGLLRGQFLQPEELLLAIKFSTDMIVNPVTRRFVIRRLRLPIIAEREAAAPFELAMRAQCQPVGFGNTRFVLSQSTRFEFN
jgi:hypothetical protein